MTKPRKAFGENFDLLLFEEVDGVCPKCTKPLMREKNGRKIKMFEKAHIYPLNPTPEEIVLLKDEEKLSEDVNAYDNLIALCGGCHGLYDDRKTVEEYREMIKIKKRLLSLTKSKHSWSDYPLEADIASIIDELANQEEMEYVDNLEFDPKEIDNKTNVTLKPLTKRKIKNDVEYFKFIQSKLKAVDSIKPTSSDLIAQQIKSYYIKMEGIFSTQEEIYYEMVKWINQKSNSSSEQASGVVISFFVQNCEIFK
jgi:DNA repair ATPase RecN